MLAPSMPRFWRKVLRLVAGANGLAKLAFVHDASVKDLVDAGPDLRTVHVPIPAQNVDVA